MKTLRFLLVLACVACPSALRAQDFYLFAGHDDKQSHSSYAWQLAYQQKLFSFIDWGFSWINEGHYPTSHRDGPALQLLARRDFLMIRLSLMAGYGPYRYFDTESSKHARSFKDAHGWGQVLTAAAAWNFSSGWLVQARLNHIVTDKSLETTSLQFGLGYRLSRGDGKGSGPDYRDLKNEVTAYYGKTIVNSTTSQSARAYGFEYRRELRSWLDWTAGYLHEGNPDIVRRGGVTTQFWPKREFFGGRAALGAGFGAYAAVDERKHSGEGAGGGVFITGLMTMTASYRFSPHIALRANWNRTITSYNRDTDVMTVGAGYRF